MRTTHTLYVCETCHRCQPLTVIGDPPLSLPTGWRFVPQVGDLCSDCFAAQAPAPQPQATEPPTTSQNVPCPVHPAPVCRGLRRMARTIPLEQSIEAISNRARQTFGLEAGQVVEVLLKTLMEHWYSNSDVIAAAVFRSFNDLAETGCYDDVCRWVARR